MYSSVTMNLVYTTNLSVACLPRAFPTPVPDDQNKLHYIAGKDPNEQHLPSKLDVISTNVRSNIPFTPTSHHAKNVGFFSIMFNVQYTSSTVLLNSKLVRRK